MKNWKEIAGVVAFFGLLAYIAYEKGWFNGPATTPATTTGSAA